MWGQSATAQYSTGTHLECPICKSQVPSDEINSHIDKHLDASQAESSKKRQRMSCSKSPGFAGASDAGTFAPPDSPSVGVMASQVDTVPQMELEELYYTSELPPPSKHTPVSDSADSFEKSGVVGGSKMSMPAFVAHGRSLLSAHRRDRLSIGGSSNSSNVGQVIAGSDSATASLGSPDPCSPKHFAPLQPEEHMRADLLGSRTHALRCARDESAIMHVKLSQLCGEVQQCIQQRGKDFESYPMMVKPTDPEQQRARNAIRGDLGDVARTAVERLKFLVSLSREREDAIRTAEAVQLKKIDGVMAMLEELRAETAEEFQMCKEEEALKRRASEDALLAMQPCLTCLDGFVRHLVAEVDDETAKAIQVHTENLEILKQEQSRFVNANDSPQKTPIYAKVIEDITSTERVLEEHSGQSAPYKELLQGWEEVLGKMPSRKQAAAAAIPRKRTLLDRLLGRS